MENVTKVVTDDAKIVATEIVLTVATMIVKTVVIKLATADVKTPAKNNVVLLANQV